VFLKPKKTTKLPFFSTGADCQKEGDKNYNARPIEGKIKELHVYETAETTMRFHYFFRSFRFERKSSLCFYENFECFFGGNIVEKL
jgi:hypothetical protein